MKNVAFICILLAQPLISMDGDEESTDATETTEIPTQPAQKLQLNYPNKKITPKQFEEHIQNSPKLIEYNAEGHGIRMLPTAKFYSLCLTTINLNNGPLEDQGTLPLLLCICPVLERCSIAHNKLQTLNESMIPSQYHLTHRDCSNNQINHIDFTQLRWRLPALQVLNASNNKQLTDFNTEGLLNTKIVTRINLHGTQLSDLLKKQILKNTQRVSKQYTSLWCDKHENTLGTTLSVGFAAGTMLGMLISMPLGVAVSIKFLIAGPIGGALAGPVIGCFGSIYSQNPENREVGMFAPQFDTTPNYAEEEITTCYQRFIRHFPYMGNLSNCCRKNSENTENTPLLGAVEIEK